jgi:hypothetical protein
MTYAVANVSQLSNLHDRIVIFQYIYIKATSYLLSTSHNKYYTPYNHHTKITIYYNQ